MGGGEEGVEEAEEARAILRVEEIAIEEGVESREEVRIVEIVIRMSVQRPLRPRSAMTPCWSTEFLRKSIRRIGLGICGMMRECAMRRVRLYWSWVRGS